MSNVVVAPRERRLRRLAVVDPVLNDGGGGRFVRALLPAMKALRPKLDITLFAPPQRVARAELRSELQTAGVNIESIQALRFTTGRVAGIPGSWRFMRAAHRRLAHAPRFVPRALSGNVQAELELIARDYDALYFSWPYGIEPPRTTTPLITTIHDLNFKYFFGQSYWPKEQLLALDRVTNAWVRSATIIASSEFMSREIQRFYADSQLPVVIRLAPFSRVTRQTDDEAERRVESLGVQSPYVLYPTHPMVHKNLGPLIAAIAILSSEFPNLKLMLTGDGTQAATGRAAAVGSMRDGRAPDVIGLGYVSHADMDALIRRANVVVSTSLYEAGNGPGIDAWGLGVPVAMSDIEVFREHIESQSVEAALFDPRSPHSIAEAIRSILRDPRLARERAVRSREAIQSATWEKTASAYLGVIDQAVNRQSEAPS